MSAKSVFQACWIAGLCAVAIVFLVWKWGPWPAHAGIRKMPESPVMRQCRTMALAIFQYQNDRAGT
jgi:hypothetical protein